MDPTHAITSPIATTEALSQAWARMPRERVHMADDAAFARAVAYLSHVSVVDPVPTNFIKLAPERAFAAIVTINAINACYWAPEGAPRWQWRGQDGFRGMLGLVVELARTGGSLPVHLAAVLKRQGTGLLLLPERLAALHEVATAFPTDGSFGRLLMECGGDASVCVQILVERCPSFSDRLEFADELPMHKRAWLTTMLGERLTGIHPDLGFRDPERLALAIDYRLPVACRWLGLLTVADDLAARIAAGQVFDPCDRTQMLDEQAVRLATALCFRRLLAGMPTVSPARLDLLLWAGSQEARNIPAHRFQTMAY